MIKHPALLNIFLKDPTILATFQVDTLSKLSSSIIRFSSKSESIGYKDYHQNNILRKGADKLKGDLFEIFAEVFFQILGADNRIGVGGYQPTIQDDYGVDGQGIGMDGKPLTVQVKFRSDATSELTQDDIKQFAFQSIALFDVEKDTKNNMIVFTNAKGLHWVTEQKVFAGRIRTLGYEQISQLVNGNTIFWSRVMEILTESLKNKGVKI